MTTEPFPPRVRVDDPADAAKARARGEMLAWIERALAYPDVTLPDKLRAEGEELVRSWKWARPKEPRS